MAIPQKVIEVAGLLVAIGGMATAAGPLAAAGSGVAILKGWKALTDRPPPQALPFAQAVAATLHDKLEAESEPTRTLIPQMIAASLPSPAQVMDCGQNAEAVVKAMTDWLEDENNHHQPDYCNHDHLGPFRRILTPILDGLFSDPTFNAQLVPAFQQAVLARLAEIAARVDKLSDDFTAKVQELGITQGLVIALAKRIAPDVADFDTAHRELDRAIEVAARRQREGTQRSNLGAETDAVMAEVAQLNADGQLDAGAEAFDAALERIEAEKSRLLDAALDQDILRRNAPSAAGRLWDKLRLEVPEGPDRFAALRALRDEWYQRGRDKGLNFDAEVAIELARQSHAIARDPDERGATLNDLGIALQTLGRRESGTARLEQVVAVFCAALQEYRQERVPLNWAMTQNNLGNALATLGQRERVTGRSEAAVAACAAAVAAYRAALQEWTRERVPLAWAATQSNLGNALAILSEGDGDTTRLEEAVAAYRAALQERTQERVPLDWAATQNNLGIALKAIGAWEGDTTRLEQAAEAFRAALRERTRERVPLDRAATQNNLASVEIAFFDKTGDPARLDAAEAHVLAAREVFQEAGASHYLALADAQIDKINHRRGTLKPSD